MGLLNPDFSPPRQKIVPLERVRGAVQIWKATQLDTRGEHSAAGSL